MDRIKKKKIKHDLNIYLRCKACDCVLSSNQPIGDPYCKTCKSFSRNYDYNLDKDFILSGLDLELGVKNEEM